MSIWKHRLIQKSVELENPQLLTLGEGETPYEVADIGTNKLVIKREDKNPSGSWKDRGTAYKLTQLFAQNTRSAVISSSGNAAISYLHYIKNLNLEFHLHVVVSPDIDTTKRALLEKLCARGIGTLHFEKKARRASARISAEKNIPNLRASTDQEIVKGYWSLGYELYDELIRKNQNESVVISTPVSSGTTTVGMIQGLHHKIENEADMPKIIMCQTPSCHPLIDDFESDEKSLAEAITDKALLRRPQLEKIVSSTNGRATVVTNKMIHSGQEFYRKQFDEDISPTSALSLAGILDDLDNTEDTLYICIASGR